MENNDFKVEKEVYNAPSCKVIELVSEGSILTVSSVELDKDWNAEQNYGGSLWQ